MAWSGRKPDVRGGGGVRPPAVHTLLLSATLSLASLATGLPVIRAPDVCLPARASSGCRGHSVAAVCRLLREEPSLAAYRQLQSTRARSWVHRLMLRGVRHLAGSRIRPPSPHWQPGSSPLSRQGGPRRGFLPPHPPGPLGGWPPTGPPLTGVTSVCGLAPLGGLQTSGGESGARCPPEPGEPHSSPVQAACVPSAAAPT